MRDTTQSTQLRELQSDMFKMYDNAKEKENAAQMERLSKAIANLTKQIKEQQIHEREVVERKEAVRYGTMIGATFSKMAKEQLGDDAIPILAELAMEIDLIAEAYLT